jgi:hypothetical protein
MFLAGMMLASILSSSFSSVQRRQGSDGQFDVGSDYIRHEAEIFFSYTV